jgi:hypothetical protein
MTINIIHVYSDAPYQNEPVLSSGPGTMDLAIYTTGGTIDVAFNSPKKGETEMTISYTLDQAPDAQRDDIISFTKQDIIKLRGFLNQRQIIAWLQE